ncbi:MAG: DUF2474 domain-containing protein [Proteobacteria bacterium]|nr:DUF2474 domain-containing protein [Pseudomonadota bacterium]
MRRIPPQQAKPPHPWRWFILLWLAGFGVTALVSGLLHLLMFGKL